MPEKKIIACTFAGHREMWDNIADELEETILDMIEQEGVSRFYIGENGEFDALCAKTVRRIKKTRYSHVELILVQPYMMQRLNELRAQYASFYDDILIPEESDSAHPKQAIPIRNRWMVDHSDALIAYLRRDFGGAWNTFCYAHRQKKYLAYVGRGAPIADKLLWMYMDNHDYRPSRQRESGAMGAPQSRPICL